MTASREWMHIGDDAWERYGTRVHYTVHEENDRWVARGYSLRDGSESKEVEESAHTLENAKRLVQDWESEQKVRRI